MNLSQNTTCGKRIPDCEVRITEENYIIIIFQGHLFKVLKVEHIRECPSFDHDFEPEQIELLRLKWTDFSNDDF